MKTKLSIFIFFLLSVSSTALAQRVMFGDEKAIISSKKNAIVKIRVLGDVEDYEGTGTYIGNNTIITNYHVVETLLNGKSKSIKVINEQGDLAQKVSVGACGGPKKNVDLCILKVEGLKLSYPFKLLDRTFASDYKIKGFGYCRDRYIPTEYTGNISRKVNDTASSFNAHEETLNHNIDSYVTNIMNCHGSSGGPLFDPVSGDLLGIFTAYYYKSVPTKSQAEKMENATFTAITSQEIIKFMKENSGSFREIACESKKPKLKKSWEP